MSRERKKQRMKPVSKTSTRLMTAALVACGALTTSALAGGVEPIATVRVASGLRAQRVMSSAFLDQFDGHVRPVLQHCAEDVAHAPLANALPPFDLAPRDLVSGDARRVVTVRRRDPVHCGRLDLGDGK